MGMHDKYRVQTYLSGLPEPEYKWAATAQQYENSTTGWVAIAFRYGPTEETATCCSWDEIIAPLQAVNEQLRQEHRERNESITITYERPIMRRPTDSPLPPPR